MRTYTLTQNAMVEGGFLGIVHITCLALLGRDQNPKRTNNFTIFVGNETSVEGRFTQHAIRVERLPQLSRSESVLVQYITLIIDRYSYIVVYHQKKNLLTLCQVQAWNKHKDINMARSYEMTQDKPCPEQQSTSIDHHSTMVSDRAVDNRFIGRIEDRFCTMTTDIKNQSSLWSVDLQIVRNVKSLCIRGPSEDSSAFTNIYSIFVGNDTTEEGRFIFNKIYVQEQPSLLMNARKPTIYCNESIVGRFVYALTFRPWLSSSEQTNHWAR